MAERNRRIDAAQPQEADPWPATPTGDIRDSLSYRLALLSRVNDRVGQANISGRFDITLGEWRVLAVIAYLGEASLRAVAREAFLDEGQVSRSVSGLVARGLVFRTVSERDRRGIRLRLSPRGQTLYDQIFAYVLELNQPDSFGLSIAEHAMLMELLDRMLALVRGDAVRLDAAADDRSADARRGEA